MTVTPNLQLPYIAASQAQKHVTHNEALRVIDALAQLAVIDRDLTSPPDEPEEGDRYIVAADPTGGWAGRANQIAAWIDGAWQFSAPRPGWLAWVLDEGILAVWDGSAWNDSAAAITALQNLAVLGIGTTADDENPFAAKLNKALWTARYDGEGGDGNLRYTLNKEATGNVLSLLMQSGWSGRAEVGLVGTDDLAFKVSPDGAVWTEALTLQKDGAAATFKTPLKVQVDSGLTFELDLQGGSGVFQATRYIGGTAGPVFFGRKARGARATPSAVQAGDTLLGFRGYGFTGTEFVSGSSGVAFLLETAEAWAHGAAYGTQIRFFTTANGSTTNSERLRIADSGDLQMGGANTVINAARHPVLRAYTVATLPAASPAGQLIYVADGSGNRRMAVSEGTDWRWPDGGVVA